jgi:hypothetical protein
MGSQTRCAIPHLTVCRLSIRLRNCLSAARSGASDAGGHAGPELSLVVTGRPALRDSRRRQVGNRYSIPGLAGAFGTVLRATRSDAENDVGESKAPPACRFTSVRRRSQERLRTCPSLSGLDRITTTILDATGEEGGIQIPPDTRSVRKLVIPLSQRFFGKCPVRMIELGQAGIPRTELDQWQRLRSAARRRSRSRRLAARA